MTAENHPYHYNYTQLDRYLTKEFNPQEIADSLRETRLALAEQLARDGEAGRDWKLSCYQLLYSLEDIFRPLQPRKP